MVVIDASVTLAWCLEDEATPEIDEILMHVAEDGAHVPEIWFAEVGNALIMAEREKQITQAEATHFAEMLSRLPLELPEAEVHIGELLALSRQFGLTAYEATYLGLAMKLGLPLATLGDRLRSAARGAGIELLP